MRFGLLLFCCAATLLAQVDTGTVSGRVTDQTGGAIPGAAVTIKDLNTNAQVQLTTDQSGLYTAPALRPGRYQVTVVSTGFMTQHSQPFELHVQDRVEMNFQLQLGATNTEVTVSAAAPLLESETSSLGQVVGSQSINDLPLNGRTFIQLATLTAGTLVSTRTAERDNFISNGARAIQNSYLLDGIDNKNRIMGFDKSSAQVIQPVVDAIEEFKVQTSTFSAEFGQAAGGVVNVSMKSGTNNFHGDLFEFLRNSTLDATPYFQPAGQPKPLFIQNQFGATFGGPIIKNKTFFFGSWQSSREGNAAPQIGTVPTAAEHQGIFPNTITDPLTKKPFPNNTIPASQIDPVAAGLFALYPLPNLPGAVNNFFYNPKEVVNNDNYTVKIDQHFGSKDYLFGRVSQGWGTDLLPTLLPSPANQQGYTDLYQRQLMLSETHNVSANKLNEFRLGYTYTYSFQDVFGPRLFDQYDIKGALNAPDIKGLPHFALTGFSALGTNTNGNAPLAATGSGNYPATKSGKVWELFDNFSWIKGHHTFKFGVDLSRVTMFVYATNDARPNFTFNGSYTGSGAADFLLGDVYQVNTSQQQIDTIQQYIYNGYAQDDWKVSSKLTLNIGLRYELSTPFFEEYNRQANYVLQQGPCFQTFMLVSQESQCGAGNLGRGEIQTDYHNFAPRLGFAYQADSKTVIRGGTGIFYGRDETTGVNNRLARNPPFITQAVLVGTKTTPIMSLQNGIPADALSLASGGTKALAYPFNWPMPYVEQWNINIERQFAGNLVAQIGYTGSQGHHLPWAYDVNQAFPGTGSVNSRRPFQGVGVITYYAPIDNSNYNALIAKLERRFASGLSLLASYTYGHSFDLSSGQNQTADPGPQNAHDLAAMYGSSDFDVRQRFVFSGFYLLPFGKSPGFVSHLVRGWELTAIFSAQTGQPFTPTLSTDPSNTGTTAFPMRLGNGNLPANQRSVNDWFDTSAFAAPTCICFGNSGRSILEAPSFIDLDLGLIRNFHIGDRFMVQFRAESFNLMNHPNLGLPVTAIGNPRVGTITDTANPGRENQLALKLYF